MVRVSLQSSITFTDLPQDDTVDGFAVACDIEGDLSNLAGALKQFNGPRGIYWRLDFEVGILFGTTELAAVLIWKENV
jgi:hypothetical protein